MICIQAGTSETGCRLDRIVRKRLPLMSLSGVYALIRKGGVRVSGRRVGQDYRLQEGDRIEINADASELAAPDREPHGNLARLVNTFFFKRNFRILHEDRDFLACNKPAGLVVHPGTGHLRHDTLIDLAAAYLLSGGKIRERGEIAPAHRLDRDTSGVILIAKNKPALRRVHEAIRNGAVVKLYAAVCHRRPPDNEGEIAVKLIRGRDGRGETTMRVGGRGEGGVFSRSVYRVSACERGLSRIEVLLDTGRTHQIRIHCAHVGAPVVGDTRYGDPLLDKELFSRRPGAPQRLYLHAQKLEVPAPGGGKRLSIHAPLPEEFIGIMR
ncbi:MAG: RluA family pseudouridine synthase [Chitinispirillaceae bacterium]|nr:RluA family pseudouridine synthase [Chitinispirillaceae bacterium]